MPAGQPGSFLPELLAAGLPEIQQTGTPQKLLHNIPLQRENLPVKKFPTRNNFSNIVRLKNTSLLKQ